MMSPTKPTDFPLLLEVFRDGLALGLISKGEIIAWADNIINNETEPDYFFIELSLAKDINEVCELFDRYISWSGSPIPSRVLLGFIYEKLQDGMDAMAVEQVAILTSRLNGRNTLSGFESDKMYLFEDYEVLYMPNTTQLLADITSFLIIYKDFSLNNYGQWQAINSRIEESIKVEQAKLDAINQAYQKAWKKRKTKQKLKRYALFAVPVVIVLVVVLENLKMMQGEPSWSKTLLDHEGLFYLDFLAFAFALGMVRAWWAKKKKWQKWPRMELRFGTRSSRKKGLPN